MHSPAPSEDRGIFITSVNPDKSAGLSRKVLKGDRILYVDGYSLRGLSNMSAASKLRESGNPVVLVLGRSRKSEIVPEEKKKGELLHQSSQPGAAGSPLSLPSISRDKTGQEEVQEEEERRRGEVPRGGEHVQVVHMLLFTSYIYVLYIFVIHS